MSKDAVTKARVALLFTQPFFGSLALRLKLEEDHTADTMWVDGTTLGYNPEFVKKLPKDQLTGLIAHEVMHLALCHHTREGTRDHDRWNVAADYAINPVLMDSGFELPADGLFCEEFKKMSAEAIYDLLPGDSSQNGNNNNKKPAGEVKKPSDRVTPAELKIEEQEWKVAVIQAVQQSKAMGKLPVDGFERAVQEALFSKVNWKVVLREFMDTAARSDYSWMQPNQRYISQGVYLPSINSKEIGNIAVAIDTSGSVSQGQLEQFSSEVSAMLEEFNTTVHVIYADSIVQGTETFTQADLPLKLTLQGGGGTDFRPVFKWVEEQGADPCCLVYLTDLCCSRYPEEPGYPVMWVNTDVHNIVPPFGHLIEMQ